MTHVKSLGKRMEYRNGRGKVPKGYKGLEYRKEIGCNARTKSDNQAGVSGSRLWCKCNVAGSGRLHGAWCKGGSEV